MPTTTDKVRRDAAEAIADVFDGATIMFGGFVTAGLPGNLVEALISKGTTNITGIANAIGPGNPLDGLCDRHQLKRMIVSFAIRASEARRSRFEEQLRNDEVELEMVPQGTLAERIRAGGAGIGGFFTRTGVGTVVADGRETRTIDGREYLFETPLRADFAFVKAHRGDAAGNLVYRRAERNFNTVMATAATVVIAEVEELVQVGDLEPESVVTPGIYVDRIVKGVRHEARWYP